MRVDRAEFFCPSPARVRQSSARARPETDSHSNILSKPDPSPTESMSQLILMTHFTFFTISLPLLNSGMHKCNKCNSLHITHAMHLICLNKTHVICYTRRGENKTSITIEDSLYITYISIMNLVCLCV